MKKIISKIIYGFIFIIIIIGFLKITKDNHDNFHKLLKRKNIEKPNIILFTLDTTRADHLPVYGYGKTETPVLNGLAERGIVFEECITAVTLTLPSHSSIMTGMFPTYHGIHINGNNALSMKQFTLAERIKKLGYKTAAFIAAFVLDGRWGLKQGFDYYDDNFNLEKFKTLDLGRVQRPANEVVDSAVEWLEKNKNNRFFTWVHLYDPHTPYAPPEPYFKRYEDRGRVGLYDGEISFMDSQIGRIIDWLKINDLEKKTIIILMGDHGESLGDHNEDTHGYFIYDSTIRVPLIIVTPFKEFMGKRVKTQVRTVDVFPTILDILKIPLSNNIHGKSLIPLFFKDEKDRFAYSESLAPRMQYNWGELYSLRTTKFKYIEAPRPEFYDLIKDPKELNNLFGRKKKISKEFKDRLFKIIKISGKGAPKPETANLDKETMNKLATLGYIGTLSSGKSSLKENRKLPDPKDRIKIFNMISLASEYISEKHYKKALEILEKVVEEDSKNPQVRLLLASSYLKEKKYDKAKNQLDIILKTDPENLKALITLANLFYSKNNYENTKTICKKILSIDKNYTQALGLMGRALMEQRRLSEALKYFKRAVEVQPKLTINRLELAKCYIKGNQYDNAKNELEYIINHHPDYLEVHYHLALVFEAERDYESAIKEYLKEIKNHPNFIPARFNYAKIIYNSDIEEYIKQMEKIIKINPKSARGYIFLARGFLKTGREDSKIIEYIRKGLLMTDNPELKALGYYVLADVYKRKGDNIRLRDVLNKAKYYEKKIKKGVNNEKND
jgi:arylsulfatase A-like enzyme/Tfp pilus assembly protein PilF